MEEGNGRKEWREVKQLPAQCKQRQRSHVRTEGIDRGGLTTAGQSIETASVIQWCGRDHTPTHQALLAMRGKSLFPWC